MLDAVAASPPDLVRGPVTTAPTSHAQRRLWFFDRIMPGNPAFVLHHAETLTGPLDETALRRALDALVARHELLHTTFAEEGGVPVQVVHSPRPAALTVVDLSRRLPETRRREVDAFVHEEIRRGFDLDHGPLARFALVLLRPGRQILSLTAHRIVMDPGSVAVFGREFAALYAAFKAGRPSPLPEPRLRYADVVARQNRRFVVGGTDPQLLFWRDRLRGIPATSEFPTDRPRPAVQTFAGASRPVSLAPAVVQALRDLVRRTGTSLSTALSAAFCALLNRYSGQGDLAVGTPWAGRSLRGAEAMIGPLLNTVVLRVDLGDDPTVRELLHRVEAASRDASANPDVPFELLVDDLKPGRDPSRHPLVQTLFGFRPAEAEGRPQEVEAATTGARLDLSLALHETAGRIAGAFEYATDLFAPDTVVRLAGHFEAVVAAMAADPDARVSRLELIGPAERHHMVEGWNATERPMPPGLTLPRLLAEAARANPAAVAVTFDGATLTYAELDRRARRLAARLRRLGAGPEVRIGLCAERSLDWAVAIVAVLHSGAALVPLDPTFPPERLAFLAADAGVALVLTEPGPDAKLVGTGTDRLDIHAPVPADGAAAAREAQPGDLAYVVYTSGSTGRPKGVMVEQAGVANFVLGMAPAWGIGPESRLLQFTALGFDIGLSEVLLAWTSGATLHLARKIDMMPGASLVETLRRDRITHVTLPPSGLALTEPEGLPDLKLVISGGEPCDPALARRWAQHVPIVNAYGPTEATIYATVGLPDPITGLFPIGRPIPNMRVHVLDRHGEPVPVGVTGEIHIGGIGVARGYLGRPDLTAERFVPDAVTGRPGRLYRTGDLGRFDATGTLHYLGRTDRQLKVRGYRIEPGEIESVLRRHGQVADAAVVRIGNGPEARLIAYLIPDGAPPPATRLRAFVAGLLPDYMAPAAYVTVEAWPKTPNGKIDHAALPRPERLACESATAYTAPEGETERCVAAIWRECLQVSAVGRDDNFFDLGGHSLLLAKVHGRLRDELDSKLPFVDLFRYPTVRLLAAALRSGSDGCEGREASAQARVAQRAAQQKAARLRLRRRTAGEHHA